jgi:hypothetical protein
MQHYTTTSVTTKYLITVKVQLGLITPHPLHLQNRDYRTSLHSLLILAILN